ncbi:17098_t:CDS:10 [Cetraspora pellucida]|uniref:17098_t:CDS:1 n=1 Tax=Cetraspora pellucida TaxID=1433469 RepID=A0A9N8VQ18_9GLOM|nr:17098_t:CDS:10 [Cetraspora pellucida]
MPSIFLVLNKYNLLAESNPLQLCAHADELSTMLPDWKAHKNVKEALYLAVPKNNTDEAIVAASFYVSQFRRKLAEAEISSEQIYIYAKLTEEELRRIQNINITKIPTMQDLADVIIILSMRPTEVATLYIIYYKLSKSNPSEWYKSGYSWYYISKEELTKKYSKQTELLKALRINILKGYPNFLASNITIPELENCYECNEKILLNPPKAFTTLVCNHILHHDCFEKSNKDKQKTCPICFINNEGMASAEVQNIDISEAVKDEDKETSNLTEAIIQSLIKELSMPSKPIDDNDKGNKSKESKPITLLQLYYNANQAEKHVTHAYQEEIRCWYLFAKKFEERVKEIKNDNSRYNDQQARGLVYDEVTTNLLGFTRDSLRKKTAKTKNIYKLFGESYDSDTKKIKLDLDYEDIKIIKKKKVSDDDFLDLNVEKLIKYDLKDSLAKRIMKLVNTIKGEEQKQWDQILGYLNKHLNPHLSENIVVFDVSGLRDFLNITDNPLLPFNLKKDVKTHHVLQVICEMILADLHVHDGIKVFRVLTDLNETWNIYWIEEKHIKTLALNNQKNVMRLIGKMAFENSKEIDVSCDEEDEFDILKDVL